MRIDFHVHTEYSIDSLIKLKELAQRANALKIIPAITDHNNIAAHQKLKKIKNFEFIPGEEITVAEGFDLIGLYLNKAIERKTPFAEAIDLIREQGGLVYLPHPFDITRSGIKKEDARLAEKVDIIEAFNARSIIGDSNNYATALAEKYKKPKGAGSDSHFLLEFGKTYVELGEFDINEPKELMKKLRDKRSRAIIKGAPFYVRGAADIVAHLKKLGIIQRLS